MLAKVSPVLILVPFKSARLSPSKKHYTQLDCRCQYICTYNSVWYEFEAMVSKPYVQSTDEDRRARAMRIAAATYPLPTRRTGPRYSVSFLSLVSSVMPSTIA
jgi:hypothetical protein